MAATPFFFSRPDITPPPLEVKVLNKDAITPGYIFIAPWSHSQLGYMDVGPYIYDSSGSLVWAGSADFGGVSAHSPHVCQWKSVDHLCFFLGSSYHGFGRGVGIILDSTYRIAATVRVGGSTTAATDMHEFKLVNGHSALVSVYQVVPYDLSPFGVSDGIGWIAESMFQEIRVSDGKVLFEWSSLDHEETSPRNALVLPGATPIVGNGLDPGMPWDYFHLNSVDKFSDGDYLVSARHASALFRISHDDGRIVWQLNGQQAPTRPPNLTHTPSAPTFTSSFSFSSQHDARIVRSNATHTLLTLFDNASDDHTATSPHSRALLISLDHAALHASLAAAFAPADAAHATLSGSQGSAQLLPDGHAFVGWGRRPFFSEHSAAGETLLWAQFAPNETDGDVMSYRARKADWAATPHADPTLWAYSRDGSRAAGTVVYVSWNGATEVARWRFYAVDEGDGNGDDGEGRGARAAGGRGSRSARGGGVAGRLLGTAEKTGFETRFRAAEFAAWTFAEAVGRDGRALRRSKVYRTFVPREGLRGGACDEWGCAAMLSNRTQPHGQVVRPEQVDWAAVRWNGGLGGRSRYPPQPSRDQPSLAWQVVPQMMLLALVVGYVFWLWAVPKLHAKTGRPGRATGL